MSNDLNLDDNELSLGDNDNLSLGDSDDLSLDNINLSLDEDNLSLDDSELSLDDKPLSTDRLSLEGLLNNKPVEKEAQLEDVELSLEDNDSLSLADNPLSLNDTELVEEVTELSLEDDGLYADESNDLSLEDGELEMVDTSLAVGKLNMGTGTTALEDDDELVLYDEDLQPQQEEEPSEEELANAKKLDALDRKQKAQKKYRKSENSVAESRNKLLDSFEEFESSYEGYFEQLDFGGKRKERLSDLVQYGDVIKLSPLVKEWSGNLIATFRSKVEDAIANNKEFKVEELMKMNLREVNINKAYDMPMLTYVTDLFSNELEYNDYSELLNRYKLDLELTYAVDRKSKMSKTALKIKYRDLYFPILNNLRHSIQELVNYDDPDEHLTFIEKMDIDNGTFVCGHCGEENDTDIPFYDFYFLPEGGIKGEVAVVLGSMNKCDYCNKYNILSAEELKSLERLYRQGKTRIIENLGEFLRTRRQSAFSFAKYTAMYEDIMNNLPSLVEHEELEDIVVEEVDVVPDLSKAILRYKSMLDYFRGPKHIDSDLITNPEELRKTKEEIAVKNREPGAELGRYFEGINEVKPDNVITLDNNDIVKYEVIAKLMCSVVSVDYNERKRRAINSLVGHLQSSKYGRYLRYSDFISLYAISQSKGILKELRESEGAELMTLAMDCYSSLALGKKYTDLDSQPKEVIIKNIEEGFENVDKELKRYLELRELYLRDIKASINDLGQIYVGNNSISDDIKEDYFVNDDVRPLLDMLTNRMIMNDVAEEFFQAWFTSYKPDNNSTTKKVSRNKSFTNIKDFTGNAAQFLETLEKAMKEMDSGKKGKFKHARNIMPSVYPDANTTAFLDNFIKLKLKMDTDEYETLVVLDDILNGNFLSNRILNRYVNRLKESSSTDIKHLVQRYGKDRKSRLKYYFEGIFTSKEIEEQYDDYMDYVRINKIIERLPNEDFKTYIDRYKGLVEGDYNYKVSDTELLQRLRESYVLLDACNVISATASDMGTTNKVEFKVAMNTILNSLLAHYGKDDIIDILGYETHIVNGLLNNIEPKDFYSYKYTYSEFKLILKASSYLYNNMEINAELSEVGLNVGQLEGVLRKYAGELDSIGNHIEDIGDVNELITS